MYNSLASKLRRMQALFGVTRPGRMIAFASMKRGCKGHISGSIACRFQARRKELSQVIEAHKLHVGDDALALVIAQGIGHATHIGAARWRFRLKTAWSSHRGSGVFL